MKQFCGDWTKYCLNTAEQIRRKNMAQWTSQNKIRPGTYINFTAIAQPAMTIGDRGISTMAIPLNWGPEDELIDVYSTDMTGGSSLAKVGVTAADADAKLLTLMLSGCYLAKIYRLNSGGSKATATSGGLTITAKYTGTKGNSITVSVVENNLLFTVDTYVDGTRKHTQTVSEISELESNAFVDFSGSGSLIANAGITLTGGSNGAVNLATAYPAYLALARKAHWQTMALTQGNDTFASQFAQFADEMRNNEGRYVQVVVANYDSADSISVINSDCGVVLSDGATVTAEEATAWVAGITAGAAITESNGSKAFPNAVRILSERTDTEIKEALTAGKFILSTNMRGTIKVENDINSLHTITSNESRSWRLNQVVRVMDEIGTSIRDTWEQSYQHKVQNNSQGRLMYRAAIIGYMNSLQNREAIDNFLGAEEVSVEKGEEADAVVADLYAQPIAAMSKLYMTVTVTA